MAVPIPGVRDDLTEQELGLYLPILTTSPSIPQAGNSYLSNIELKDISAKAIYIERGPMESSPGWDGQKYDWTKGMTEIQTDFIDAGDSNSGGFNILENTALSTMQTTYWTSVFEKVEDNPISWVYSTTPPADTTKIWVNTSEDNLEPKYWSSSGWSSYMILELAKCQNLLLN